MIFPGNSGVRIFLVYHSVCLAVATKDNEVLLGAIPREDMDVVLDLKNQTMDINPESPYYASMKLK